MKPSTAHNPHGLTDRQVEIMDAVVASGCSKEVAADMGIGHRTADGLVRSASRKLGARNRTLALLMWDRIRRAPVQFRADRPVSSVFQLGGRP